MSRRSLESARADGGLTDREPRPARPLARAATLMAALTVVMTCALGLGGGCSVETPSTLFVVPGTPAKCEGQVYYEVSAEACFTFGCSSGTRAFALCESGAFTACSCQPPCAEFKPAPGSSVPDAELDNCEGGIPTGDSGSPRDAHAEAHDAPSDTREASPGDVATESGRDGSTDG
jgi:hypothetical protein